MSTLENYVVTLPRVYRESSRARKDGEENPRELHVE